jgi:hypothetical protein
MISLPNEVPMPEKGTPVEAGTEGFAAILNYPDHKVIRDDLYERVVGDCEKYSGDSAWGTPRHVFGQKYSNKFCKEIPEWNKFISWIDGVVSEVALHINNCMSTGAAYDIQALHLYEYWGMLYKKGTKTLPHNHFPYAMSFGYYLNVPDGSPPLIIGGEKLYPKEGEVVIFPASTVHSVPESDIDNRVMIAGNFAFQPSRFKENHPDPAGQTQETLSNMPPQMQAFSMKMRQGGMDPGSVPDDIMKQIPKEVFEQRGVNKDGKTSRPSNEAMEKFFGRSNPKPPGFSFTQKKKKKGFTEL